MSDSDFGELIGQTVVQLQTEGNNRYLGFALADGRTLVYAAEGSCCNDVWFNHISGTEALLGQTIRGAESRGWVDVEATRQDVEEAGFWVLMSERGRCVIEVRNSHNGYYGGSICFRGENAFADAVEITEDF